MTKSYTIEWAEEIESPPYESTWEIKCSYKPGFRGNFYEPPCDGDILIESAVNLHTKEKLNEEEFVDRFGEDVLKYLEAEVESLIDEDYWDYCDRLYDDYKDRQVFENE